MLVAALNVQHGLCVQMASNGSSFVFDCGTHSIVPKAAIPLAWKRLAELSAGLPPIDAIAVSHLHWDHYCGFLEPLPWVRDDVALVIGRLPTFPLEEPAAGRALSGKDLRAAFAASLLAFTPLDPKYGPLDVDLMKRIRRYADHAQAKPVSLGDQLEAGGHNWRVLWPPRALPASSQTMSKVRRAVELYDRAAQEFPELRNRLDQVRESETYNALLDESPDRLERQPVDAALDERELNPLEHDDQFDGREDPLEAAGRALRAAANAISLVMHSEDSILLTGDAVTGAMNVALSGDSPTRYGVVVTPHHGGERHVPSCFAPLRAAVWVTSAGGRVSSGVGSYYDAKPGIHHRTDDAGSMAAIISGPRLLRYTSNFAPSVNERRFNPWWPFLR